MSEPSARKGRGCFFYGCLTIVILLVIVGTGSCLAVRYVVSKAAERFTETAPMELPQVQFSPAELKQLQDRIKQFSTAIKTDTPISPLVLTERDVNMLIAGSPDLELLKGKVYISLEGDQIKGSVSVPMEMFALKRMLLPSLKGRYLNGAARFEASLTNGVLIVMLHSLTAKGVDLPPEVMRNLRNQNLAQDLYQNAETAAALRRLESIAVEDGRILIKPKRRKDE